MSAAVLAGVAGGVLAALYFGWLWRAVSRVGSAGFSRTGYVASYVARLALVALVFYVLVRAGPLPLALGLAGFLVVRSVIVRGVVAALDRPARGDAPWS